MEEERKLVAVLFADVADSTAIGEDLDPEDIRSLMGRYYEHAREIVTEFSGTLEKFIGDAAMAVFGVPRALGDDAERALAAALALRRAVSADPVLGDIIQLRMGVNLGEVVAPAGETGDQFIASGDTVNTAARLQTAAQPGEILVSERTVYATEDMFSFGPRRLEKLRGKREPVSAFPLVGPRPQRRIERPPILGRKAELQQLALVADRALSEETTALVTLIGAAGIGKTRILEEFSTRLDPQAGFRVAWVSVSPYGRSSTAEPLRQLLGGLLIREPTVAGVEKALAEGGPVGGPRGDHLRRVAETIVASTAPSPDDAPVEWGNVIAGWRFLVEQVAAQTPLLIIFDDTQLYQDELLGLIERLVTSRARIAFIVVVLARPELLDRRPAWGGGRLNSATLPVGSLAGAAVDALVSHYQPDMDPAARRILNERSGGNPFFALELLRASRERTGVGTQLPETVHAAILARIDLLGRPSRALVRTAAAAGPLLPSEELRHLIPGLNQPDFLDALDDVLARDFLQVSGVGVDFRHALVRDVAYNSLSRIERVRIHARTAELLGHLDVADDCVQARARHYQAAIALSRQSATRLSLPFDVATAIGTLKKAGQIAACSGAFLEAQVILESAIQLAPESQHGPLHELLGDSVGWSPAAVRAYQAALSLTAESVDEQARAETGVRLRRKLLILLTRGGLADRMDSGLSVLRDLYVQAHRLAPSLSSEYERLRLGVVDLFLQHEGHYLEAVDDKLVPAANLAGRLTAGDAAASYFRQARDWTACSEALDGCQAVAAATGRPDLALEFCRSRMMLGDLPAAEAGDALSMLCRAYQRAGDVGKSIEVVDRVLNETRRGQPIVHLSHAIAQAVSVAYFAGDWSSAERLGTRLEEAYEEALNSPQDSGPCLEGFFCLLCIAVARADNAQVNRFRSLVMSCASSMPHMLSTIGAIVDMEITGDPERCQLSPAELGIQALGVLAFRNDRGLLSSPDLISTADQYPAAANTFAPEVARVLATGSVSGLAATVDKLHKHNRVLAGARLGIVLAQLSGDRAQLERSRAVLAQIGDTRFLERAADVAASW